MNQQQTAISLFQNLVERETKIMNAIKKQFSEHKESTFSNELRTAIGNRLFSSETQKRVKVANYDEHGIEMLLLIQFYGIAHNFCGADWSENTLVELKKL